ncbi:MAG: serine/threonine protein kinase [Myxococcales bacterium]|nr:serine/threonine protein kinase [Myxococcales bacterium]
MAGRRNRLIQVGQVLDKYELLERVGQGGMAVVYRGLDRQLKRTVAIKILHRHLSDYQEARDRFEREAQAVAKLRHENILEIFDYSAKEGSESYIVTEFIDGQTLKQFITDRPISFPEIGAMVILQVCRALAHAHAVGILHRDIKPENIMIRSDGLVKLMDFGISHMVDLERLTVTGQLLGSPAYMAPEHVEGRQLDFRTDVFAVGIVLYQLCVGKLPFEGKNPHEVLKRIAECKFTDPRQANPRIGNRLGRIILKAMSALPNDRYSAIGEMVLAIEAYLEESGLPTDKLSGELARYFKAPVPYEQALKDRLLDALTRRGQKLLDEDNQAGALDVFDRVLTIDPKNQKVLSILDRINRRARLKTVGLALLGAVAIGGGAFAIHLKTRPAPPEAPPDPTTSVTNAWTGPWTTTTQVEAPPPEPDAGVELVADAEPAIVVTDPGRHLPTLDAGSVAEAHRVRINVFPKKGTTLQFDDGPPTLVEGGSIEPMIAKKVRVRGHNDLCSDKELDLSPTDTNVDLHLTYKPGSITPHCANASSVKINDRPATLGQPSTIVFDENATFDSRTIKVEFVIEKKAGSGTVPVVASQNVSVKAAANKDITCEQP